MSRKYCKVETINNYPVSVAQVRQLRRNSDWCMDTRKADVGTWGRLTGDLPTAISGTATTYFLSAVTVDLRHYDTVYFGVLVNGSGTATWTITLSMTGGASYDVTLSLTNPGSAAVYTGSCNPGHGQMRTCSPQVTVTRTSGTGTLEVAYIGLWGYHAEGSQHGPQLLQPALAGDIQAAMTAADRALAHTSALLGWFGSYTYPTVSATVLRWYLLGDKLDDDESKSSVMTARCVSYQTTSAAGKTWTTTHSDNGGDSASVVNNSAGVDIYQEVDLPALGTSYDTSTPWSGGKIDVVAQADANRPTLRAVGIHRSATTALRAVIEPAPPIQDWQIRTVEDATERAIGINDVAEYVHKCTWYQGGNVSGGMATGKAYTISTSYVTVFDGLIWVHDDAQSGATWGSNTYQVAVRASNGSTTVDMTCRLTVDGQTGTATKSFAAGEQYVLFDPALTGIDVTKYAVACKVELLNSASRSTTVYSVHISRRGAAY